MMRSATWHTPFLIPQRAHGFRIRRLPRIRRLSPFKRGRLTKASSQNSSTKVGFRQGTAVRRDRTDAIDSSLERTVVRVALRADGTAGKVNAIRGFSHVDATQRIKFRVGIERDAEITKISESFHWRCTSSTK